MSAAPISDGASTRPIRKFHPGTFQSDAEVIDQFVVRRSELRIVLDVLRGNVESQSCQHVLIVAPRGRGKTMLLARTAAELRTDSELAGQLFPVRFMEESHEIFNLTDFWLETLFHLARESAAHDAGLAAELRATHADLTGSYADQTTGDRARAAALAVADRLGRKLVLMVENLQSLRQNVDPDFGWMLRRALQSESQIILIASATSRFKGLDDAQQPFFELFRIIDLEPLSTEDCGRLWQAVSGDEVSRREIRPLQILTGGSPRLLVIVAGFAKHRSLRQLMEELVTLIDEHTEYFRSHLEVLGKVERRVYLAVIDLWQPSRPGEIAARARLDVRVVSTMLGRLVVRGAVIPQGSGKKRLYSAAERLYSIYYKLRRERDEAAVVRNLVHFMAVFYSEAELLDMSDQLRSEAAASAMIREGIERALAEMPSAADDRFSRAALLFGHISNTGMTNFYVGVERKIDAALQNGTPERVIEIANQALAASGPDVAPAAISCVIRILLRKGEAHERLQDFDAAIAVYDEAVARFGDSDDQDVQWWVARTLGAKADAYRTLGNATAAIAAFEHVVEKYGVADPTHFGRQVAWALISKGRTCADIGEMESALAACDELVARFSTNIDPNVQWWVATAFIDQGYVRHRMGNWESAIAAYDEVVKRFDASEEPSIQSRVAVALANSGLAKTRLGLWEAAIETYDEVVTRYGASDDHNLQWWVAAVLVAKARQQVESGVTENAVQTCDELESTLGGRLTAEEQGKFMWQGMSVRARALAMRGEHAPTVEAFRSAYSAFVPGDERMMRDMLWLVPDMVATGISADRLVKVLSGDSAKRDTLLPLIVALREYGGEEVRAPEEVRRVAEDVRKRIETSTAKRAER